jgi:hypothetical protein
LRILWKIQSADKLCSWQKAKRATIPETQRTCLLRLLGSGRANGAGRKSNYANFLASLSASTTAIAYKREERRGDQANGSFWARRNRELCSTQHALRINIEANFYAVAARFERQRKKKRQIAVSSDLRRAILGDIYTGDLFGGL